MISLAHKNDFPIVNLRVCVLICSSYMGNPISFSIILSLSFLSLSRTLSVFFSLFSILSSFLSLLFSTLSSQIYFSSLSRCFSVCISASLSVGLSVYLSFALSLLLVSINSPPSFSLVVYVSVCLSFSPLFCNYVLPCNCISGKYFSYK